MAEFKVQSGGYRQIIRAQSFDAAIEKFLSGKDDDRLGELARIREVPFNGAYHCDSGADRRRGSWRYVDLDRNATSKTIALVEEKLRDLTSRIDVLERFRAALKILCGRETAPSDEIAQMLPAELAAAALDGSIILISKPEAASLAE